MGKCCWQLHYTSIGCVCPYFLCTFLYCSFIDEENEEIARFSIGEFSTRSADKAKALKILKKAGYDSTPDGYILHHGEEVMEVVDENVHKWFTHRGGFSRRNK